MSISQLLLQDRTLGFLLFGSSALWTYSSLFWKSLDPKKMLLNLARNRKLLGSGSTLLTSGLSTLSALQDRLKPVNDARSTIAALEERMQRDEGRRGINAFVLPSGELYNAACEILDPNTKKVAIITGFPCMLDYSPPTETDGPLGALAMARAILAVGKEVVIVTDECNEECILAATAASGLFNKYPEALSLESFPGVGTGQGVHGEFDDKDNRRLERLGETVQLVIAIERAGPSADGSYRTMRGRDMTPILGNENKCNKIISL